MTLRGLYRCGYAAAPADFTGVDAPCEQPSDADLASRRLTQSPRTTPAALLTR
jgi:adenylylsulfate kinase-like enzyme